MAYTLCFAITLGSRYAGITLNAQIVSTAGANTGSAITTGFTEIANGHYLLNLTTIPDDHRGGIKFYESGAAGTILAFASINPEEGEYGVDPLGSGSITFTYTLTSTVDSSPIADAAVWVTTDEAGTAIVASGITNASGEVVFYLDADTYYIWRQKVGWNFTNPDTEVVA